MLIDCKEFLLLLDLLLLLFLRFISKGGEDGNDVVILDDVECFVFVGWYLNLNVFDFILYCEVRDLVLFSWVYMGGLLCLMVNFFIFVNVLSMICGIFFLFDYFLGFDCFRRVICVVLGDRDLIDYFWRLIWVWMIVGLVDGGM